MISNLSQPSPTSSKLHQHEIPLTVYTSLLKLKHSNTSFVTSCLQHPNKAPTKHVLHTSQSFQACIISTAAPSLHWRPQTDCAAQVSPHCGPSRIASLPGLSSLVPTQMRPSPVSPLRFQTPFLLLAPSTCPRHPMFLPGPSSLFPPGSLDSVSGPSTVP